jgi:hypothetical protein
MLPVGGAITSLTDARLVAWLGKKVEAPGALPAGAYGLVKFSV